MVKRNLIMFFILAIFGLVALSCSSDGKGKTDSATPKQTEVSKPADSGGGNLSFTAYDLDGNLRSSSEFAGKPLIVNIWGTWCPPCRMEMPGLKKIYDEYKPLGLEIVGLATERTPNNQEGVRSFARQYGYNWVMLMADNANKKALGLGSGVPYTVFIDRDGNITNRHTGYMSYEQFKEEVQKIM